MTKMPKAINTGEKMTYLANGAGKPGCEDAESEGTGLTFALLKTQLQMHQGHQHQP